MRESHSSRVIQNETFLPEHMIYAIVAMSKNRIIGREGGLPWHLPEDLKRVSNLTVGHVVLMGKTTYSSLPEKFRPLPRRTSLVVSSSLDTLPSAAPESGTQCHVVRSIEEGVQWYEHNKKEGQILWIFGGSSIYEQTRDCWDRVYLTLVDSEVQGDRKFPEFESAFDEVEREDLYSPEVGGFSFIRYDRNLP
jgi:dihydrofolate reductase